MFLPGIRRKRTTGEKEKQKEPLKLRRSKSRDSLKEKLNVLKQMPENKPQLPVLMKRRIQTVERKVQEKKCHQLLKNKWHQKMVMGNLVPRQLMKEKS